MSNEALKLELIEWLARLQDQGTLASIRYLKDANDKGPDARDAANLNVALGAALDHLKKPNDPDWYEELTDEQRGGIARGMADIEAGRVISSEELRAKFNRGEL